MKTILILLAVVALLPVELARSQCNDTATSTDAAEWLQAHNTYRAQYGAPALKWSQSLANHMLLYFQQYIKSINTSCLAGIYPHSKNPNKNYSWPYGENLGEAGFSNNMTTTPTATVASWVSESANYSSASKTCSGTCGHFTQVVWYKTTYVGCASVRCRDKSKANGWYYTNLGCQYVPSGNCNGYDYVNGPGCGPACPPTASCYPPFAFQPQNPVPASCQSGAGSTKTKTTKVNKANAGTATHI